MTSRKRTSRRRSSRTRSTRLVRNGMVMKIVVPVAVAGIGVGAYLLWKRRQRAAADAAVPGVDATGTPNAAYLAAQQAGRASPDGVPGSSMFAPFSAAASSIKDAANAAANAISSTAQNKANAAYIAAKASFAGLGRYYDVSAAGAPYQGMFGLGSDAVSTVEPHDLARRAKNFAPVRPITRPFASPVVRTGGVFSRDLFTGME